MKFKDFDAKMRLFETGSDQIVPLDTWMVVRLDGRRFTKLTKETMKFEAPYDIKFRDIMVKVTEALMNTGFNMHLGYTQSDEISLLLDIDDDTFGRKLRKINSVLAGQASAVASLSFNTLATFDCRVSQLPTLKDVTDYFVWREADARRNSLNSYIYWALRNVGMTARQAHRETLGLSVPEKKERLIGLGINWESTPEWTRTGTKVGYKTFSHKGYNPVEGTTVETTRRILNTLEADLGTDKWGPTILSLIEESNYKKV